MLKPTDTNTQLRGRRVINPVTVDARFSSAGTTRLVRTSVLLVGLVIVGAVTWAFWAKLDETTIAKGAVIPAGQNVAVRHLEGGILSRALVAEGQLVEAGTPIVRLSPVQGKADLEQARVRRASLVLQGERLRARADGREANFGETGKLYPVLQADQLNILASEIKAQESQMQVLGASIREREAALNTNIQEQKHLRNLIKMLTEEVKIRTDLHRQGYLARPVLLVAQRDLADAIARLERFGNEQLRTEELLAQGRQQLIEFIDRARTEALDQAGKIASLQNEVEQQIAALEDRVNRTAILTPVRGIVQRLVSTEIGTVIEPGGLIAEIVPVDRELLIEIQISPRDIGFVRVGQDVRVKVDTFDFSRYGTVNGKLSQISASAMLDEKQQYSYRGYVRLNQAYVGDDPTRNNLQPGMTVQTNIKTGRKTVAAYLLRPIYQNLDSALNER
jgi:HlyD family type I secretion membrane fusion protein